MDNCKQGTEFGCCCNCSNQTPVVGHPANRFIGRGSIIQPFGFICDGLKTEGENLSVFLETPHGFCELYLPKQKENGNP
jgi:hypothetical protein